MRAEKYPGVIRIQKLRNQAAVGSSAAHTWRTMPVHHADATRTHLNEDWRDVSSAKELRAALAERLALADRRGTNPVLALEYLVTAPHEAFQENGGPVAWRPFCTDALAWIERRHGRENVVAVNVQLDERTPHMVVYVCPLVRREATTRTRSVFGRRDPETGKQGRVKRVESVPAHIALSADHFVGTREKLIRLQSDFAAEVGERHGLRRGIERSALRHVDMKLYHDALVSGIQQRLQIDPEILKRQGSVLSRETPAEAADRVAEILQEQVEAMAARAATADLDRQRAREWEQTAARAQADRQREQEAGRRLRSELEALVGDLTPGEVKKIREYRQACVDRRKAREDQKKAQRAQEQQRREAAMVARIRALTPWELAQLPDEERAPLWDTLVVRSDLGATLDEMLDSGLFEPSGMPRAGVNRHPPTKGAESAQNEPAKTAQNEPARSFGSPGNGSGPNM